MNDMQIKCFLAAAGYLNFTEAASRLYINQSVLSRHIASLEQELNMKLFLRYKGTVCLTPAGTTLANAFTKLQDQFKRYVQEAQAKNKGVNAILNIGFLEEQMLGNIILKVLQLFRTQHPNVEITIYRLSYRGLRDGLYDRTLDIAVTFEIDITGREGLMFQTIDILQNYLVIPANHPKANIKNLNLFDFKDDTFLTVAADESELVATLLPNSCREAGFTPTVRVAPDFGTLSLWLEAGYGIFGLNKEHMLSNNPKLKFISIPELVPCRMGLVWCADNPNAGIQLFRTEIMNVFSTSDRRKLSKSAD